jgi:hypothetical protein
VFAGSAGNECIGGVGEGSKHERNKRLSGSMLRMLHYVQFVLRCALGVFLHVSGPVQAAILLALTLVIMVPWAAANNVLARVPINQEVGEQSGAIRNSEGDNTQPLLPQHPTASVPHVSYEDGQLTVIAENSLLSDILSEVHTQTGADIDLPASASEARIWVRLGPGPARKILAELLSNTELNYVIQGSDKDGDGVRNILLTARTSAPSSPRSQVARNGARALPKVSLSPAEASEQESSAAVESRVVAEAQPEAASTPRQFPAAANNVQSASGNQGSDVSRPLARTSEGMIQQLQSMYQQRRQMQQAQRPAVHQ